MTDAGQNRETEPVALWQDDWLARWMIPVVSDQDPDDPSNPWQGWFDIDADATTGLIDVAGIDFTPSEARTLARCLHSAADHIDMYTWRRNATLFNLTCPGEWPEISDQPIEIQRIARRAVQAAADRVRRKSQLATKINEESPTIDQPPRIDNAGGAA